MKIRQEYPSHDSFEKPTARPKDALFMPAPFSGDDIRNRLAKVAMTTRELDDRPALRELSSVHAAPHENIVMTAAYGDVRLEAIARDADQDTPIPLDYIREAGEAYVAVIQEGQTDDPAIYTRAAACEVWLARSIEEGKVAGHSDTLIHAAEANLEKAKEIIIYDPSTTEVDVLPIVILEAEIAATMGNPGEASSMLEGAITNLDVSKEITDLATSLQRTGHLPIASTAKILLAV